MPTTKSFDHVCPNKPTGHKRVFLHKEEENETVLDTIHKILNIYLPK